MQILGSAPPQPSQEQLREMLKEPVTKLIETDISQDVEPDRQFLYRRVLKNDLYWRGIQYLVWNSQTNSYVDVNGVSISSQGARNSGDQNGTFDEVYNIYRGAGKKFAAVLGQRSPNVKAVADDPSDESSVTATHAADTAATVFRATWQADQVNMDLAQRLWKSGTCFFYTPWVADGDKYGFREEPQVQQGTASIGNSEYSCQNCGTETPKDQIDPQNPSCPNCQAQLGPQDLQKPDDFDVPQMSGTQKYPNGAVELQLYDLFSVTCTCFGKTIDDLPWLKLEFEEYKGVLLKAYPEIRQMDGFNMSGTDGSGSSNTGDGLGAMVRASQASPMGNANTSRSSRWNYRRTWLTTSMYESIEDSNTRNLIYSHFPDGMKVTQINDQIVKLENEKLSAVWSVVKPDQSEYILAEPWGQDLIPAQDLTNDLNAIGAETIKRGIPVTLADPRIIDFKLWKSHQAQPAEVIPVLPGYGQSLGEGMYQLPAAAFSGQQVGFLAGIVQQAMENVGVVPAIFGGEDGDQTAHEAEIKKNAALQQLGMVWLGMRKGWERAYTNGVKILAKYGSGQLKGVRQGAGGAESVIIDMASVQDSGWHFEAEEAIPQTWGQKRDMLLWMMEKPPNVVQAYGFADPMNLEMNKSLLGFDGYVMPGVALQKKTIKVIQKLLQQKVIQDPNGGDPQPSIPLDWQDDPQQVTNTVKEWLLSASGMEAADNNPDGYANVVAYGKAAGAAIPPTSTPPPPPPPAMSISGKIEDLDPNLVAQVAQSHGLKYQPPSSPSATGNSPSTSQPGAPVPPGPPGAPPQQAAA